VVRQFITRAAEVAVTKEPLPGVEGLAVAAMEPEADQGLAAPQI